MSGGTDGRVLPTGHLARRVEVVAGGLYSVGLFDASSSVGARTHQPKWDLAKPDDAHGVHFSDEFMPGAPGWW